MGHDLTTAIGKVEAHLSRYVFGGRIVWGGISLVVACLGVIAGWYANQLSHLDTRLDGVDARDRASAAKGWAWGDAIDGRLNGHDKDIRALRRRHGDKLGPPIVYKKFNMDVQDEVLTPEYRE